MSVTANELTKSIEFSEVAADPFSSFMSDIVGVWIGTSLVDGITFIFSRIVYLGKSFDPSRLNNSQSEIHKTILLPGLFG